MAIRQSPPGLISAMRADAASMLGHARRVPERGRSVEPDLPLPSRPEWHQDAACRDCDVNDFYPTQAGRNRPAVVDRCLTCPVRALCADQAMSQAQVYDYGWWAGISARHRPHIRRRWTELTAEIDDPAERGRIAIQLAEEAR